jgi:hypothetical protein
VFKASDKNMTDRDIEKSDGVGPFDNIRDVLRALQNALIF